MAGESFLRRGTVSAPRTYGVNPENKAKLDKVNGLPALSVLPFAGIVAAIAVFILVYNYWAGMAVSVAITRTVFVFVPVNFDLHSAPPSIRV